MDTFTTLAQDPPSTFITQHVLAELARGLAYSLTRGEALVDDSLNTERYDTLRLKVCPKCGSDATLMTTTSGARPGTRVYRVRCYACRHSRAWYDTQDEAMLHWNKMKRARSAQTRTPTHA